MTDTTDWERETQVLLAELEQEQEKLDRRVSLAAKAAQEGMAEIETFRKALAIYRTRRGLAPTEIEIDENLREEFRNLTVKEVLIRIAERNGGILDGADAGEIMVAAGMFKNIKNASGNVYSTLGRSKSVFRRVARGKYQLLIRPVPQTVGIPIESRGTVTVTEPIGPIDEHDPWELDDDEELPKVAPAPEQPEVNAAGHR